MQCFYISSDDGSCKHVMCLLFSVVDFCERNSDRNTASCTDTKCQWSVRRKESKPMRVVDLDYRHDRSKPKKPGPTPDVYKPLCSITDADILRIREHLTVVRAQLLLHRRPWADVHISQLIMYLYILLDIFRLWQN